MNDDPNQPQNGQTPSGQPVQPFTTPAQHVDPTKRMAVELPEDGTIQGEGNNKKHSNARDFWSFFGILAIAACLALLLITFVFRSYAVDGPSMESALQNQDKLIIWKVPRTIARVTGNDYIPNRGDIVVFTQSNLAACGQNEERQLIKRVIALPGERVVVQNGEITVYNTENPNGFKPDRTLDYNKDGHIPYTSGDVDVLLARDQLFVSGDNRPDSCDSRAFGPIAAEQLIGKLVLRLLPANKITIY